MKYLGLLIFVLSCQVNDENEGSQSFNKRMDAAKIYMEPHEDGNSFACASCHSLTSKGDEELRRAGHPLTDVLYRSSYKNNQLTDVLDAVNNCRVSWMTAPEWKPDDVNWLSLLDFLKKNTEEKGEVLNIEYTISQPPTLLSGGDAEDGQDFFNKSCIVCHGLNGTGTLQGPGLKTIQLTDEVIAKRLRLSGPEDDAVYSELEGGRMPFWSAERMSNTELRDIIAFLKNQSVAERKKIAETGEGTIVPKSIRKDLSLSSSQSNCSKTSRKIGAALTLSKKFHGVEGVITVIDDCTLHLDQFSYDGLGVDVRVYAGKSNNFDDGLILSRNMLGLPFEKQSALLRLPSGVSLDSFDSLSIWCVPIGISFGEGVFVER